EWAAAGREKPAPPTYTVETAGGEPEVHEHDETTLATDEDRAAWASYLVAKAEWEAALKDRLIRVVFLEGVRTRPASDDWVKRQQFLGLAVPDDPLEREVHYVKTVLVRTPEDAEGILTAVMALSGVD